MTRDVICLSDKSSIKDTIETMLSNQIGAIPLVDADDKLAGIVTERDIVLSLAGVLTEEVAQDYMSTKVFTTTPGTPIESACKIMVRNGLRRIPIVGGEADISKAASEVLKNIVSNIMAEDPITVSQTERIGDICALFAEKNIGGVPVTKDGEIIGIITEKDILNAIKTL